MSFGTETDLSNGGKIQIDRNTSGWWMHTINGDGEHCSGLWIPDSDLPHIAKWLEQTTHSYKNYLRRVKRKAKPKTTTPTTPTESVEAGRAINSRRAQQENLGMSKCEIESEQ